MSFYSYRSSDNDICPGRITGDCTRGLTERVCIQVKKVYDSCIQQEQLDNVNVKLVDICPAGAQFTAPITFISCPQHQHQRLRARPLHRPPLRPSELRACTLQGGYPR